MFYVERAPALSLASIWVRRRSPAVSRLNNEDRTGPGPKGSRQKVSCQAVMG